MNPIVSNLIELIKQDLVKIKQESDHNYAVTISDKLTVGIYSYPGYRIWDSISKTYTNIDKKDWVMFIKSIENKHESLVINEIRKVLEAGQNKALQDGLAIIKEIK